MVRIDPAGPDRYGISEAATKRFHKTSDQLTLAEAAMLAGLLRAPSNYSPIRHPARARKRRDDVLMELLKRENISEKEYQSAIVKVIVGVSGSNSE